MRPPPARNTAYTDEQRAFLVQMFEHKAYKIKYSEVSDRMALIFKSVDEEDPYYKGLFLSCSQIKSWFSTREPEAEEIGSCGGG